MRKGGESGETESEHVALPTQMQGPDPPQKVREESGSYLLYGG